MENKKNDNSKLWDKIKDIIIKMGIKKLIEFIIELLVGG